MRNQSGFSLLETMVAGLVTASGLSGIAALLVFSLAETSQARDRANARLLASNLYESLRPSNIANVSAAQSLDLPAFEARIVEEWKTRVSDRLPGGAGVLCRDSTPEDGEPGAPACDGAGASCIKVFWLDQRYQRPSLRHVLAAY